MGQSPADPVFSPVLVSGTWAMCCGDLRLTTDGWLLLAAGYSNGNIAPIVTSRGRYRAIWGTPCSTIPAHG